MAQQAGVIFEHASELKLFTLGQNKRVEAWIARNWKRASMTGPIDKSYVSKALSSLPVLEPVVKALDLLFDDIRADPWAWCKPPERVEDMPEYAPLSWWYDVLKPPVPWTAFACMSSRPLKEAYREVTQTRLSEWSSRLRAACDQFMADHDLLRALRADEDPEYQYYGDGQRHRVGNPGLRGRTPEEIGLAYAFSRAMMPLPLIEEARLDYDRPNASPVHDHISEPIEPWMGLAFEGVERGYWEDPRQSQTYRWVLDLPEGAHVEVEHKVLYYWDGSRYLVEDVAKFARIKPGESATWRDTTQKEHDLQFTGIERKHDTVEELLARRGQWIADHWASMKADWAGPGLGGIMRRNAQPDGVPESEAVAFFDAAVEWARTSPDVRAEQEDVARARSKVMRDNWRRRS